MRTGMMRGRLWVLLVLLPFFWGCRDFLAGLHHHGEQTGNGVPVSIVLGYGSGPSRTIAPEHLDQATLGGYTLELTGSSDMGDSVNVPNFTLSNGVGMCDLSPGVWNLELVASNGGTQVLRGEGTVEVRGLPTYVSIMLTPVTSGTGTVRLTVNWQAVDRDVVQPSATPYPRGLTVRMALYDPVTGQKATSYERRADGSDGTASDTDAFFRRGFTGTGSGGSTSLLPTTFTYTGGTSGGKTYNVPAGMYTLKFMVTGGNLPAGTALQWSDLLYVEAGRETTGTIDIPQMATKPAAPAAFTESCTAFAGDGTYTATLNWGIVYNAESYELEVMRYTAGTTRPRDDGTWTTAAGQQTSTVFTYTGRHGLDATYTNPGHAGVVAMRHVAGGLLGGQNTIQYKVKMTSGEGFAARMRAVNSYGSSTWVYLASPMVPELPYFPTSFSGEAGEMRPGDSFLADFKWKRGIVDANGTYELELLAFTGGTKPTDEATWNAAGGRATYSHKNGVASAGSPASLVQGVGGLAHDDEHVQIEITGTTKYYTARLRAVNSEGGASDWLYIPQILLPQPVYTGATTTKSQGSFWDPNLGRYVPTWNVTMHVLGPKTGTRYGTSWLRCVRGNFAEALDNDARYEEMSRYSENYGSNLGGQVNIGSATEYRAQMNDGSPFLFRIRWETPYGNTGWWYWPQEVRQLP